MFAILFRKACAAMYFTIGRPADNQYFFSLMHSPFSILSRGSLRLGIINEQAETSDEASSSTSSSSLFRLTY